MKKVTYTTSPDTLRALELTDKHMRALGTTASFMGGEYNARYVIANKLAARQLRNP